MKPRIKLTPEEKETCITNLLQEMFQRKDSFTIQDVRRSSSPLSSYREPKYLQNMFLLYHQKHPSAMRVELFEHHGQVLAIFHKPGAVDDKKV